MSTIQANIDDCGYPIYIGKNLLSDAALLTKYIMGKQVLIVSNQQVANHYLSQLQHNFQAYQCDCKILPDGELHKNLQQLCAILDSLLDKRHQRDTTLIALGGGVVGDTTGFAAACYQRGVNFIQCPTSLLAQVDASVGGKTAVNYAYSKNMIGAFYQPKVVVIDTNTLSTLPKREFCAGIAEVIKAALLGDYDFFTYLEENMLSLLALDDGVLQLVIQKACAIKVQVVKADSHETKGIRELLNLGHTFAHALEQAMEFRGLLHGEAVAIGVVMAAELSCRLGCLDSADVDRIARLFTSADLPINIPTGLKPESLLELMKLDKKVVDSQLRFVLLKSLGKAELRDDVPEDDVLAILEKNSS